MRTDIQASEEEKRRNKKNAGLIKGGLNTAIGIGTAAIGGGIASKIAPFLSTLIPQDLAMKGINKISPKLGKFISQGQSMGLDLTEGLNFLRTQFGQESTAPASGGLASDILPDQPEAQNIQNQPKDPLELLSGYSPELVQFITQTVKKGQTIKEAVSLAKRDPKLARVISQIEKELGKDLASIVTEMFGGQSFQGAPTVSMGAESMKDVMQQGGGQQQANQGDQQLKAMFDKIMSM